MTIIGYDNVALVGDSTISSVTLDINGVRVTVSGAITASVSVVNGYYQASIAGSYNTMTVSYAGQTLQVSNIALDVNSHFTTADEFLATVLSGNDTVNGTAASESLTGYAGNDTLDGKAGSDSMVGGLGDDTYFVDNVGDVVTEASGEGTDTIKSAVTHTLAANVENLFLVGALAINGTGNAGDNLLTGNGAANTLDGGAGADILVGGLGNDTYVVDDAGDVVTEVSMLATEIDTVQSSIGYTLSSNLENLTLTGTADVAGTGNSLNNILTGNAGNNTLIAGGGNDLLDGGLGADTLTGDSGNDTYVVDDAGDIVIEASTLVTEVDAVKASIGYTLTVNVENLTLTGTADIDGTGNVLNNTVVGNDGNNYLDGGQGTDTLKGGRGNDTYIVDLIKSSAVAVLQDTVAENLNEGIDTLSLRTVDLGLVSATTLTLAANLENINLTATGSTKLNLTGNTVANVLTGNAAANILDGGTGTDTLIGGAGNDTYIIDNTGDQITELDSEGTDLVKVNIATAGLTYALGTNIENGILTNTVAYSLTGNGLGNLLTGNAAANTLTGGIGNDTLNGGIGVDTLIGGTGDDTYVVDNALDIVNEETNIDSGDLIQSSIAIDLGLAKYAGIENLTLTGTAALNGTGNVDNNTLTGNAGANILDGKGGADTLIGGLGNDTYLVDDTNDTITELAAGGTDTVKLTSTYAASSRTAEANVENLDASAVTTGIALTGNGLANMLTGGAGNDTLDGGDGVDTLKGGLGNDTYLVDLKTTGTGTAAVASLQDTLTEVVGVTGGSDTLQLRGSAILTNASTLTLATNLENLDASATGSTKLNLTGNTVANVLTGNAGNNTLDGGLGNDTLIGGAGNDTYVVDNTLDTVTEVMNEGTDTVNIKIATTGTYNLGDNIENGTLLNAIAYNLTGNVLDNILTGNATANTLTGGDGNDTLNGGAGTDTLIGGAGNDTYVVDNALDIVNEEANTDSGDLIQSSIAIDLGLAKYAGIENLTLAGTVALNGTGNDGINILTGNAGANILDGKGGADTLIGGAGNDTYLVDDTNDTITELAAGGTDTVKLTSTYAASSRTAEANVENLDASAVTTGIALTGNGLANMLTGGAGNDTLDGVDGVDTLKGGLGNDTYIVDLKTTGTGTAAVASLQDTLTEVAGITGGTDTLQLRGSASLTNASTLTLAANLENLDASATGSTKLNLTGNTVANVLTGNAADNVLSGGAGNDTLIGGAGNDRLKGGLGNDTFDVDSSGDIVVENLNEGIDTVSSSISWTLEANLENLVLTGTANIDATGNTLNNVITGNSGNNILSGGAGDDTLMGDMGNDTVDGGTGINDVLMLSGSQGDYVVVYNSTTQHYTVTGLDGVDDVVNVEFLSFTGGGAPVTIGNLVGNLPIPVSAPNAPQYAIEALDSGSKWTSAEPLALTYSFMTAVPSYYATSFDVDQPIGFAVLNDAHKLAVRQVLQGYADIINVTFSEVLSDGVLQYGSDVEIDSAGYAYFPGLDATDGAGVEGDVWLDNSSWTFSTLAPGEYGLTTIVHETGHALGLKHPGDYDGLGTGPFLPTAEDTGKYSVMSYNDRPDGLFVTVTDAGSSYTASSDTIYSDSPSLYDVAALQSIYGANTGFASGSNVYTFSDAPFFKAIWDGGGTDTIDVSGLSHHSIVDLRAGEFSSINYVLNPDELLPVMDTYYSNWLAGLDPTYTGQNNVAICYGVTIENAVGSAFDDRLIGNEVANGLEGGAGNDLIVGGGGSDVLTGGLGNDQFYFNTAPDAVSNFDRISDFTAAIDKFMLDSSVFSGLAQGALSSDAFSSGAGLGAATTASQRVIYDLTSGMLYYDADGHQLTGDVAPVAFAQITSGVKPTLGATDFSIYSAA